jgi:RNA polymerase sigma-70 factor (ECF subfamily)
MANDCDLREVANLLRPYIARRVGPGDADDVLQDVLQRVYESVRAIDDDVRYTAWLHRIAHNAVIDHHRRQRRAAAKHEALAAEPSNADPDRHEGDEHLAPFMSHFVDQLPLPYREAIRLTEIDRLSMSEAAAREAVSLSAMKSRVQRGRRLLRELFEGCCEIALDARGRVIDVASK